MVAEILFVKHLAKHIPITMNRSPFYVFGAKLGVTAFCSSRDNVVWAINYHSWSPCLTTAGFGLSLKGLTVVKNSNKMGLQFVEFWPLINLFLLFGPQNNSAELHWNWTKIVTMGAWTDREKDASDFIICPMLCYSNGTDNYYTIYKST